MPSADPPTAPDPGPAPRPDGRVSVVIATRDRAGELAHTLERLAALPELAAPGSVIVVDNGSRDDTVAVASAHPGVVVLPQGRNLGAVARNVGVAHARTPYVAFADDDSWWAPGALADAADLLDAHPDVALVAARTLVGPDEGPDPVSELMAASPLPVPAALAGTATSVMGFLSCAAVVRRRAFLEVGGFDDLLFFLGEEELMAYDLAAAGHRLVFAGALGTHHHPSPVRDPAARRRQQARNHLLVALMRRPWPVVAGRLGALVRAAPRDPAARGALGEVARLAPAALRRRRRPAHHVESLLALLEPA